MRMRFVLRAALLPSLLGVAAAAPAAPPPQPSELTKADATGVLGRMVQDEDGKEIGRIVDVVVDPSGQTRAAVVDIGGFMGVGSRRVAVAWSAVHVPPPGAPNPRVSIDMTDEQIHNAPAYNDRSKPATIVGPVTSPAAAAEPDQATPAVPAEPDSKPPAEPGVVQAHPTGDAQSRPN